MIVRVIENYFDSEDKKTLRKKGQILDMEDETRAKKLIDLGYLRECEIIKVEKKAEAKKTTKKTDDKKEDA